MKANQQTRINRDKNGLYQKAMKGEITNLTGFNAPYEKPHNPDLICDTDRETVSECVEKLFIKIFK